jgi:hypothetical protein
MPQAFLKLRCDTAYYTGAIASNLSPRELAMKLTRHGMPARLSDDWLEVKFSGARFIFGEWEPDGMGQRGWLRFTTEGDLGGFSRALAQHGVRHKFEHSRPRDLDRDDWRCVTQYVFRWDGGPAFGHVPLIETFDEPL